MKLNKLPIIIILVLMLSLSVFATDLKQQSDKITERDLLEDFENIKDIRDIDDSFKVDIVDTRQLSKDITKAINNYGEVLFHEKSILNSDDVILKPHYIYVNPEPIKHINGTKATVKMKVDGIDGAVYDIYTYPNFTTNTIKIRREGSLLVSNVTAKDGYVIYDAPHFSSQIASIPNQVMNYNEDLTLWMNTYFSNYLSISITVPVDGVWVTRTSYLTDTSSQTHSSDTLTFFLNPNLAGTDIRLLFESNELDYNSEIFVRADGTSSFVTQTFDLTIEEDIVYSYADADTHGSQAQSPMDSDIERRLIANIIDMAGYSDIDYRFYYRKQGTTSWTSTPLSTATSTGTWFRDISGLDAGTTYEFRARFYQYASDYSGSDTGINDNWYGDILTFTTTGTQPPQPPTVQSLSPILVSSVGATIRGSLTSLGDYESVEVGFEWETYLDGNWQTNSPFVSKSSTGTFTQTISLSPDTEYRYRALVYDGTNYYYGDYVIFDNMPVTLTSGLVSYYKFDETSGTTAVDSHGSNDATLQGTTSFNSDGLINYGVYQLSSSNGVLFPTTSTLQSESFSKSFWVYPTSITGTQRIYDNYDDSGSTGHDNFRERFYFSDAKIRLVSDTNDYTSTNNVININEYNHIVVTYDNSNKNIVIYVNNVKVIDETLTSEITAYDGHILTLGYQILATTNRFNGYFDELAIYDRALSEDEIEELYNNGDGLAYPLTTSEPDVPPELLQPFGTINLEHNDVVNINVFSYWSGYDGLDITFVDPDSLNTVVLSAGDPKHTSSLYDIEFKSNEVLTIESKTTNHEQGIYSLAYKGEESSQATISLNIYEEPIVDPSQPTVVTLEPILISSIGATLRGELTSLGDYESLLVGFEWETFEEGNWQTNTPLEEKTTTGIYSYVISMTANQTVRFRAFVFNGTDYFYGNYIIFDNEIPPPPPPPPIPDGTFEDFFDIFLGGSSSMKFVVGLVLIIGMVIMGFNVLKSFMGALLFGIFGLVLSVILGLIGIWVIILIIILAILPIIYKLSFGNNGGV